MRQLVLAITVMMSVSLGPWLLPEDAQYLQAQADRQEAKIEAQDTWGLVLSLPTYEGTVTVERDIEAAQAAHDANVARAEKMKQEILDQAAAAEAALGR